MPTVTGLSGLAAGTYWRNYISQIGIPPAWTATASLTDGSTGDTSTTAAGGTTHDIFQANGPNYDFHVEGLYVLSSATGVTAFSITTKPGTGGGGSVLSDYALWASDDGGSTWIAVSSGSLTLNTYNTISASSLPLTGITHVYLDVHLKRLGVGPPSVYIDLTDFRITTDATPPPEEPCIDLSIPAPEFFCIPSIAPGGIIAIQLDGTA